ncbi:unnamed protein product [Colias eurytheme]|nr:unnamed protein product [Colias eurytheme]
MAWQLPNVNQWNPGLAVAADVSGMNMGSYTPEQWNLMQQQNWQQWSQWQQQYAQWQTQYGDKYAEQMQAMQAMGIAPPPPVNNVQPPAPPPPDKPPPPPPHENDQPLYGNPKPNTPTPSQTQVYTKPSDNNTNINTGNNQNWSYNTDTRNNASAAAQPVPSVNTEALRKLAEEERLFDIQFQKWEEEIQKWKEENVNHPDKRAYSEYEQKFEACRAQLLERRQQMKLKRDRLLNNAPQSTNTTNTGNNNISTTIPPLLQNSNFSQQNANNKQSHQISKPAQNYHQHKNTSQYQQYNRSNNKNVDPQDRFESYQERMEDYTPENIDNSGFLPTSGTSKGIPGLDLVPDAEKARDVIDISEDNRDMRPRPNAGPLPPDYSTISKGINNILGDEKIMNILSMVQNQKPSTGPNIENNQSDNLPKANAPYAGNPNMIPQAAPWNQNNNYNNQFDQRQPPGLNYDNNRQAPNNYDNRQAPNNFDHRQAPNNRQAPSNFDMRNSPGNFDMRNPPGNFDMRNPPGNFDMRNPPSNFDMRNPPSNFEKPPTNFEKRPARNFDNRQPPTSYNDRMPPGNFDNRHPATRQPPSNYDDSQPNDNFDNSQQSLGFEERHQPNNFDTRQNMPFNRQNVNFPIGQGVKRPQPYSEPTQDRFGQNYNEKDAQFVDDPQQQFHNDQYDNANMPPRGGRPPIRPPGPPRPMNPIPENTDYPGGFNRMPLQENVSVPLVPPKPKWVEEPLFTPSIIVEYEHKPLRLKARDFIEPVHTFDYNHKSKDGDVKKMDFEKEVEDLFARAPRTYEKENERGRYSKDPYSRDYDRRDEFRQRSPKEQYPHPYRDERLRADERFDRRDDREVRYNRREDYRERDLDTSRNIRDRDSMRDRDVMRDRERDFGRDRDLGRERDYGRGRDVGSYRDLGRDRDLGKDRRDRVSSRDRDIGRERDIGRDRERDRLRDKNRSHSRDRESRKRGTSIDSEVSSSSNSKRKKEDDKQPKHVVMIDDLLETPGREMRPEKILIILRGPPGSGKSYLAKLIRDREAEHGGTVRIMSIDDYFMQEGEIEERDPTTGKMIKKPSLKYEYDEKLEESYTMSLKRALKRSITDGYFSFIIFDAVNDQLKSYADIWNYARQYGFQVYICTMSLDVQTCFKRNIHNRKLEDIEVICSRFFPTPNHHILVDPTTLLQNAAITEVQMEDADVAMEDAQENEVENSFTSKWERMDDVNQLARLDGTSKPLRPSKLSMEDYLQLDDWTPNQAKPGKKTVRWADIEERRQQEKMRAIGFVVGQTDWNRMTDPTLGSSALTQTKYIERVRRN